MGYILGLDVGIASVGWAVLDVNEKCEPYKINNLGVRIFDAAEQPKTGAALALPRRDARGARRRNRRKKHRLERIKKLIERQGILTQAEILALYNGRQLRDIYEIRYRGLEEVLSRTEWVRLLIHLAQRRGFRSNRKNAQKKEDGKLLCAIKENEVLLAQKGYRTAGEMFYKDDIYSKHKRNTTDDYLCTLSRDMLVSEIKTLFETQRQLGNQYASETFQKAYLAIYTSQRSFDEGPGGTSPYRNPLGRMIGKCTFEKEEMRASKASYSFEYFRLLLDINNLSIKRQGVMCKLTPEERGKVINLALSKEKVTYKDLRKVLELQEGDTFKNVYIGNEKSEEVESKKVFCKMESYYKLRRALDKVEKDYIQRLTIENIDEIAYALTLYKTDTGIKTYLVSKGIDEQVIEAISQLNFSGCGHLSLKALRKLIPYLEEGMTYDKACKSCGYDFNHIELPDTRKEFIDQIANPVVRRAVSQTLKVVDAIIRTYGKPAKIHIELARDMGRDFKERKKIEKAQESNRADNEKLKKEIEDTYGVQVTGNTLVKYKLWKEQQGHCMYSNLYIEPDRLLTDDKLTDIDHIIPYSQSFDDSYNNKVLVLASENRQKSNRTPFEYLTSTNPERWELFKEWTRLYIRNSKKVQNLLKEHIDEEDLEGFKERNLNDTRYITSLISTYLKQKIAYDESFELKQRVVDLNGAITAYCRKRWGLVKVRENGDLHHALDAVVIACITPAMIQKVTKYHQIREDELLKNVPFPAPWEEFRNELIARLEPDPNIMLQNLNLATYNEKEVKPVFVSRMPRRKNKGKVHEDTLKGNKLINQGYTISRKPIQELKLKDGEIEGYYNKEANMPLYNALKNQLIAFDGDSKKAFEKGFYKPQKEGKTPIEVKKVRVQEKANLVVTLNENQTVASNESMVRVDVFMRNDKYYLVPIYVRDIIAERLPNKAITADKSYAQWTEMDENYEFQFTLYPNDLIYFKHKKGANFTTENKKKDKKEIVVLKEGFVYYISTHSATGAVKVRTHENKYIAGIGAKTLLTLEKYCVDELGNITKVNKEKRLDYSQKKR